MNPTEAAADKKALRREFIAHRSELGRTEHAVMNRDLCAHLLRHPWLKHCKRLAAYWGIGREPEPQAVFQRLQARGIEVALPVVRPGRVLSFHLWNPHAPMRPNALGIPEPVEGKAVSLDEVDLALIPLVAWSRGGWRLGMGGGYYDRAFAPLLGLDRPRRVGVAWSRQETDSPSADPWDVGLHAVLTEQGWFTCTP